MKRILVVVMLGCFLLIAHDGMAAAGALSVDQERIQTSEGRPWITLTKDNLDQFPYYKEDLDFYANGVHVKGDEAWRYNYAEEYGTWRIYTFKKGEKVAYRERYPQGKYAVAALDGMDREFFPDIAPKVSGSFIQGYLIWKNDSYMLILYLFPQYRDLFATLGLSRTMVGGVDLIYLENTAPEVKDPFSTEKVTSVVLKPAEYPRLKIESLIKLWQKTGLVDKETAKAIRISCLKREEIRLKKVPGNNPPPIVGSRIVIDK